MSIIDYIDTPFSNPLLLPRFYHNYQVERHHERERETQCRQAGPGTLGNFTWKFRSNVRERRRSDVPIQHGRYFLRVFRKKWKRKFCFGKGHTWRHSFEAIWRLGSLAKISSLNSSNLFLERKLPLLLSRCRLWPWRKLYFSSVSVWDSLSSLRRSSFIRWTVPCFEVSNAFVLLQAQGGGLQLEG